MHLPHPAGGPRRPLKFRHRLCAGFTIAEVAMATAILALGISTSITVLQRGFAMLDSARNVTTAGQILVSQMEQLRMYDWATVSAYPTDETSLTIDSVFTSSSTISNRFSLTRTVSSPATDVMQITYRVSWRNYDGRSLQREMTTYYARYGIHDYFYNHT